MRIKWPQILAWILMLAAIPGGLFAYRILTERGEAGSFAPNENWSGVLRVWISSELPGGVNGLSAWLNARASAYQRKREGVRVQIIETIPEEIARFREAKYPPDAIILTPGLLETPDGLEPISVQAEYIPGLAQTGIYKDTRFAAPIALGAYFWIVNTDAMRCAPGNEACPEGYRLQIARDGARNAWSGALLALFNGTSADTEMRTILPGTDLGLPASEEEEEAKLVPGAKLRLPESLPEDFRALESALSAFTSKQADAICATQRELARIEALADSGRAPEYAVYAGGKAFTDQIALAAVVRSGDAKSGERCALAEEFIRFLLTDDSQKALAQSRAFRATKGEALYGAYRAGMATAEASLEGGVIAAPAFGSAWRERVRQAADAFIENEGEPGDLLADALR